MSTAVGRRRRRWLALVFAALAGAVAEAQSPSGTISGLVVDPSNAAIPATAVRVRAQDAGHQRTVVTSDDGYYAATTLLPGSYSVIVETPGFKRTEQTAAVEAGTTTTVNFVLEVGALTETLTVFSAPSLIRGDHHRVGGTIRRAQVESLPLNGRNFVELAKLEPGVTSPDRLADGRVFVAPLGSGLQTIPRIGATRVTVDGANVTSPGTAGVLLQVSQDAVEQLEISTANFDLATSLTTNGALNIVTRSGGNRHHGGGFLFYRDHHMAAYPALRRDPVTPDPVFRRAQAGASIGGPLRRDRAYYFTNYERHDQRGVVTVQPAAPEFAGLGGLFPAPYRGDLFSVPIDASLQSRHRVFARYTRDTNRGAVGTANVLPSGWRHRANRAEQSVAGLATTWNRIVNDFRASLFVIDSMSAAATERECPGCFGLGMPRVVVPGELTFGQDTRGEGTGRRWQLTNTLVWERLPHRLRVGFDWEHASNSGITASQDPAAITLWAPARVRQFDPGARLPDRFATVDDVLALPLSTFTTGVGPASVLWPQFSDRRVLDLYRLFVSDTWRPGRRVTLNYGIGLAHEPNALNHDLTKPALLSPILGTSGLAPPRARRRLLSPSLGVAWAVSEDARTLVRAGVGRYFDPLGSTNFLNLSNERRLLSPMGTSRLVRSGSNIVVDGRALEFPRPTAFTGADLLSLLPDIRSSLLATLTPGNRDFATRNLDAVKEGQNLYDPSYRTPSAVHLSVGLDRQLTNTLVIGADLVWKEFRHTFINGIDYNRWNSRDGPVIPRCTGSQLDDVTAICSNGPLYFDTTSGRARYKGLLVRLEKRATARAHLLVAYALASYTGSNGTGTGTTENPNGRVFGFNNDDWLENVGPLPTDYRHVLNVSGSVALPWRTTLSFSLAAYSRPPFSAYVAGVDLNGDGTLNDLLPGATINQFGRGLGRRDLERLVEAYNRRNDAGLTLPEDYAFDDGFFTQDLRVKRDFAAGRSAARVTIFAEVFNLLNVANLTGYSGNLAGAGFGQPTARAQQLFGSGGPRAFQCGLRVAF